PSLTNFIKTFIQNYNNISTFDNQPDIPRIIITRGDANAISGSINISGIDWKGQYVTETISITGGEVTNYGNVAFMKVLLANGYNASPGNLSLGIGNKIGLLKQAIGCDLINPVIKVKKNQTDINVPAYDFVYNTINLDSIANGDSFSILYL
ncbi:MAG: hypothetical protein HY934_09475, partial [Candidatus Firestonebacteria bacterium]|nr:hypothetical protein [Candidatus Firestonebacteria bacterium]